MFMCCTKVVVNLGLFWKQAFCLYIDKIIVRCLENIHPAFKAFFLLTNSSFFENHFPIQKSQKRKLEFTKSWLFNHLKYFGMLYWTSGVVFTRIHFLCNLQIGPIIGSVCPRQAFPSNTLANCAH